MPPPLTSRRFVLTHLQTETITLSFAERSSPLLRRSALAVLARSSALAITLLVFAGGASTASADEATAQRAKAAYDKGMAASDRNDYAEAGRDFAEADALSPNAVALEAALQVAILADDPILGDELLERAKRDPNLNPQVLKSARDKFTGRAGLLTVACDTCKVSVDGRSLDSKMFYVLAGKHTIRLQDGSRAFDTTVEMIGDGSVAVKMPEAPVVVVTPTTPPVRHDRRRLISPAWAIGGGVATAALLGGTIASAFNTKHIHDEFASAVEPERKMLSTQGNTAKLRTNILVGVTAGVGAATLALGILSTRYSSRRVEGEAHLGVSPTGLSFDGSF